MYMKICSKCSRKSYGSNSNDSWICPFSDCKEDLTHIQAVLCKKNKRSAQLLVFCPSCGIPQTISSRNEMRVLMSAGFTCNGCHQFSRFPSELRNYVRIGNRLE